MPYAQNDLMDQVCILASVWVETLFYGFYLCLFLLAMYVMTRQGSGTRKSSVASKVFFGGIILQFLVSTLHEFIAIYRLMRAYGWIMGPDGTPISYYHDALSWDNYSYSVLHAIMIWIGDALVIYRCYIIWGRKVYIIVLPTLIFLTTMSLNITLFVWYGNHFISFPAILPLIDANYPLTLAQNVITTGLIAWKILKQYRRSKASGLVGRNQDSLINVVRIIVESALLYTVELLVLIILYFTKHPVQYVLRGAIIPSIGIVFLLIAIRVHLARDQTAQNNRSTTVNVMPTWAMDSAPVFINGLTQGSVGSDSVYSQDPSMVLVSRKRNTENAANEAHVPQETTAHDPTTTASPGSNSVVIAV